MLPDDSLDQTCTAIPNDRRDHDPGDLLRNTAPMSLFVSQRDDGIDARRSPRRDPTRGQPGERQ